MGCIKHDCVYSVNTNVFSIPDLITGVITLDKVVRDRRAAMGLTQAQLAKRAHVTQSALGNIEAGKRGQKEPPRCLPKLAKAFGISVDALMAEAGYAASAPTPTTPAGANSPRKQPVGEAIEGAIRCLAGWLASLRPDSFNAAQTHLLTWAAHPERSKEIAQKLRAIAETDLGGIPRIPWQGASKQRKITCPAQLYTFPDGREL